MQLRGCMVEVTPVVPQDVIVGSLQPLCRKAVSVQPSATFHTAAVWRQLFRAGPSESTQLVSIPALRDFFEKSVYFPIELLGDDGIIFKYEQMLYPINYGLIPDP